MQTSFLPEQPSFLHLCSPCPHGESCKTCKSPRKRTTLMQSHCMSSMTRKSPTKRTTLMQSHRRTTPACKRYHQKKLKPLRVSSTPGWRRWLRATRRWPRVTLPPERRGLAGLALKVLSLVRSLRVLCCLVVSGLVWSCLVSAFCCLLFSFLPPNAGS